MKVELEDYTADAEWKISRYAGICYNSKGANIKRLKADGHLATFRFAYATFKVSEVSRACAMQHLRHKFLEFLMRSQRYVKEKQFNFVIPESIKQGGSLANDYIDFMEDTQDMYELLIARGIKAEDARMILPNACFTEYYVVGNFQAWHDFLWGKAGRLQKAAQWEIKEVALGIQEKLALIAPNIFEDK